MTDDALIAWLESGAKPALTAEDAVAKRRSEFGSRFYHALKQDDLGPTQELHDQAVARLVYEIHRELNSLGETEYSAVWMTLPANMRRALKAYIEMGRKQ